jgi:hypothetical protein
VWVTHQTRSVLLVADEILEPTDVSQSQLAAPVRGAFSGRLASRLRAVLPGPVLVLDGRLLLESELYRPLER